MLTRRGACIPASRRATLRGRGHTRHAHGLWRHDEVRRGRKTSFVYYGACKEPGAEAGSTRRVGWGQVEEERWRAEVEPGQPRREYRQKPRPVDISGIEVAADEAETRRASKMNETDPSEQPEPIGGRSLCRSDRGCQRGVSMEVRKACNRIGARLV